MNLLFLILVALGIINRSISSPITSIIRTPSITSSIQSRITSSIQPLITSSIHSQITSSIQSAIRLSSVPVTVHNPLSNPASIPVSDIINVIQVRNTYPTVGQAYFLVEDVIDDKRNSYAIKDKIKFIGEYTGSNGDSYNFINNGVKNSVPYNYKKSPFFVNLPLLDQGLSILEKDWDYRNMVDIKEFLGPESNQGLGFIGKEKSIVHVVTKIPEVGKRYFHSYAEIVDKSADDWRKWKYYTSVDKLEDVGEFTGIERFSRDSGGYNFLKDGKSKFVWGSDEGTNIFIEDTLFSKDS